MLKYPRVSTDGPSPEEAASSPTSTAEHTLSHRLNHDRLDPGGAVGVMRRAGRGFIIGSSPPATIWPLAGLGFASRDLPVGAVEPLSSSACAVHWRKRQIPQGRILPVGHISSRCTFSYCALNTADNGFSYSTSRPRSALLGGDGKGDSVMNRGDVERQLTGLFQKTGEAHHHHTERCLQRRDRGG